MLSLFALNTGIIAFDGKIIEGDSDFVDTRAMNQMLDENANISKAIEALDSNKNFAGTSEVIDVGGASADEAQGFVDFISGSIVTGIIGYWTIIDKIFFAFPELGFVIKAILGFIQFLGFAYLVFVGASLLRGGFNPG